jgi:hypothetical protein
MARAQTIGTGVRSAEEPSGAEAAVASFITAQIPRLENANESTQRTARETLIRESGERDGTQPSVAFREVYARDLNRALLGLLHKKGASVQLKLNVGIVAANVAEHTKNGGLAEVAEALMKEKDPALQLWGIKTAKYVLPYTKRPLGKQIVDTVKANRSAEAAGMLAEEAELALTLDPLRAEADAAFGPPARVVFPDLLSLVEFRVQQYAQGSAPPSPLAEERAIQFLSVRGWDLVAATDANLRKGTLRDIGELACATMHTIPNSGGTDDALVQMARASGSALVVIGGKMKKDDLAGAGRQISGLTASTSQDKLDGYCKTLSGAMSAAGVKINDSIGGDQAGADTSPTPTDGNGTDSTGNKAGR